MESHGAVATLGTAVVVPARPLIKRVLRTSHILTKRNLKIILALCRVQRLWHSLLFRRQDLVEVWVIFSLVLGRVQIG